MKSQIQDDRNWYDNVLKKYAHRMWCIRECARYIPRVTFAYYWLMRQSGLSKWDTRTYYIVITMKIVSAETQLGVNDMNGALMCRHSHLGPSKILGREGLNTHVHNAWPARVLCTNFSSDPFLSFLSSPPHHHVVDESSLDVLTSESQVPYSLSLSILRKWVSESSFWKRF